MLIALLRPLARHLPESCKGPLRRWLFAPRTSPSRRRAAELANFTNMLEVHALPAIFHYWSNTWLRPQFEQYGFSNPDQFLVLWLERTAAALDRPARFISLGSGNCDTEVRIARSLIGRGISDFTIECLDINRAMLARGRRLAEEGGLGRHVLPRRGDFNRWQPAARYDAVIANQSLHHVLELEHLFAAIDAALVPGGRFITSDMIGRNGHMRWPEAMAIIQEYWAELPDTHRFNLQLQRFEERLLDWDCAQYGFEGVRAQDILPLLVERFEFEFFLPFGNLIDPFIDRGFGHHFDADGAWDRAFIDRVHARDVEELAAGRITPTHMLAVLQKRPFAGPRQWHSGLDPARCVRRPDAAVPQPG